MVKNKKKIVITDRCVIRKSKSNRQQCIYCGQSVSEQVVISLNNKTDDLAIRKNVWLHINCVEPFFKLLKKKIKKSMPKITAIGL